MRNAALAGMLVLALAACADRPLVGPSPEPVPARLYIALMYLDPLQDLFQVDPPGRADLLAFLWPGKDSLGRPRRLVGDTLRVLGTLLHGQLDNPAEYRFEAEIPMAVGEFGRQPLVFTPPVLAGVAPTFGPVTWGSVGRAGPGELTLARGDDLPLPLAVPPIPSTPSPAIQRWSVDVRAGSTSLVGFMGTGLPPADLSIPAEYLARRGVQDVSIRLMHSAYRDGNALTGSERYEVMPYVGSVLAWRVQLGP